MFVSRHVLFDESVFPCKQDDRPSSYIPTVSDFIDISSYSHDHCPNFTDDMPTFSTKACTPELFSCQDVTIPAMPQDTIPVNHQDTADETPPASPTHHKFEFYGQYHVQIPIKFN